MQQETQGVEYALAGTIQLRMDAGLSLAQAVRAKLQDSLQDVVEFKPTIRKMIAVDMGTVQCEI